MILGKDTAAEVHRSLTGNIDCDRLAGNLPHAMAANREAILWLHERPHGLRLGRYRRFREAVVLYARPKHND
jgi:hypothetical protein